MVEVSDESEVWEAVSSIRGSMVKNVDCGVGQSWWRVECQILEERATSLIGDID